MNDYLLPARYTVTAIGTTDDYKKNKRVYVDIDHHSGGYPRWSDSINPRQTFDDITKAIKSYRSIISPENYMSQGVRDIELVAITTVLEPIDVDGDYVQDLEREAVLAKLSEHEKKVLGLE